MAWGDCGSICSLPGGQSHLSGLLVCFVEVLILKISPLHSAVPLVHFPEPHASFYLPFSQIM